MVAEMSVWSVKQIKNLIFNLLKPMQGSETRRRSLDAELSEVVVEVAPADRSPFLPGDGAEPGMTAPRFDRFPVADAIDERMKRRDVLAPLARGGPPHFRRSAEPSFRPRQPVHEEVSNRFEPQQSGAHRNLPVAEFERDRSGMRLGVAEREAQMISHVADHPLRRHRSPTGFALG